MLSTPVLKTGLGLLTAVWLVVGTQSCGGKNDLYGSVSQVDNLQYDSIVLGAQTGYVTITYVRKNGEVPAKLAIDTNGLTLASGGTLTGDDFKTHVTVTHVVINPNEIFRPVVKGTITFDDYATTAGGSLSGHFAITFDSGDLLQGDFSGTLVDQNSASALVLPPSRRFGATSRAGAAIPMRLY